MAQIPVEKQIQITDVRVGFPAGSLDLFKEGKWVPVVVTVGPPKEVNVIPADFQGTLEVSTKDSDGWNTHIFKRPIPRDQLLASILLDRRAALLCRGLLGADDETLDLFIAIVGERERDPRGIGARLARADLDPAHDASGVRRGGHLQTIALREIALDDAGQINRLRVERHAHSVNR